MSLPYFAKAIAQLKRLKGNPSFSVTWRVLKLSSGRHPMTGWRSKTWVTSSIDMYVEPKASTQYNTEAGSFEKLDYIGWTGSAVVTGDEILRGSRYFEVKAVRLRQVGDKTVYYESDMTYLPFHEV